MLCYICYVIWLIELCVFFIHLFLQRHADDIDVLPDVLAGEVSLLPEFLKYYRAKSTSESYNGDVKDGMILL